jgi:uncharacterized protein (DUF111 family)
MARKKKVAKKTVKKTKDVEASDKVVKLEEKEALRFGKIDAEMRNNLQGMRLCDFEIESLKRSYQEKIAQHTAIKAKHQQEVNRLKPEYDDFLNQLSKKYGIPAKAMVIDPDTGTVRNASKDV